MALRFRFANDYSDEDRAHTASLIETIDSRQPLPRPRVRRSIVNDLIVAAIIGVALGAAAGLTLIL
jgi:hypothetical protein